MFLNIHTLSFTLPVVYDLYTFTFSLLCVLYTFTYILSLLVVFLWKLPNKQNVAVVHPQVFTTIARKSRSDWSSHMGWLADTPVLFACVLCHSSGHLGGYVGCRKCDEQCGRSVLVWGESGQPEEGVWGW